MMGIIEVLKRPFSSFAQDFVFCPAQDFQPNISSWIQSGAVVGMLVSEDLGIGTWSFQPMTVPLWVLNL